MLPRSVNEIGLTLFGLPMRVTPYALQRPVLEWVLNEVFRQAIADGDLAILEDRSLSVVFADIRCHWRFGFQNDRLLTLELKDASDVTISGELREFLLLITQDVDPDTLFFQRRLNIVGDTELGLFVKNQLDSMDWSGLPEPVVQGLGLLAGR